MRYRLKAISAQGRLEFLDFQAFDESGARLQAEERGYTVLAVRHNTPFGLPLLAPSFPLVLFSQELLILLKSGLPLMDAIQMLAEKERRPDARAVLERTVGSLRQGRTLSAALEQAPQAFS